MHHLNIDLETFSSEPIGETGAFKYIESPVIRILFKWCACYGNRSCAGRDNTARDNSGGFLSRLHKTRI